MKSQSFMKRISSIYTLQIANALQSDSPQYQPDLGKLTPLKAKFLVLGIVSALSTAAFGSDETLYQLRGENRWVLAWEENAIDEEDEWIEADREIIDDYDTHSFLIITTSDKAEIRYEERTAPETENPCTTKAMLNGVELERNQTAIPENANAEQKSALTRIVSATNSANNVLFTEVYGKDDPIPNLNRIKVITECPNYPPTGADNTVILERDKETHYTFVADEFGFLDEDGGSFTSIKITQLESTGNLKLNGANVSLNQAIPETEISNLTFHPTGTNDANFKFKVNDGTNDSESDYTMTIDVTEPLLPLQLVTTGPATGTTPTEGATETTTGATTGTTATGTTTTGGATGTTTTGGVTGMQPLSRTKRVFVEISGNGKVSSTPYGISCKTSDCEKVSIKDDPTGLQCNDACERDFKTRTWVTLTPTPVAGFEFSGWGGHRDCIDDKLLLDGNRLCIAFFRPITSTPVNSTEPQIHPVNLSVRAQICEKAENVIAGFIISGSGHHKVMLRGMALEAHVDPVLTLHTYPEGEIITTNDDWANDLRSNEIPAHLQLPNATDAGLLLYLPVGAYTVTMSSESLGVGVIALNSVDNTNSTSQLINMSTRASIQGGANDIIAGFVLEGSGTQKVMIRGFGLEDGIDTTLSVQSFDGTEIAKNDDWEDDGQAANIPANLKLPKNTDAGLLLDLHAGTYTAILSTNGNKGLGMISVDKVE